MVNTNALEFGHQTHSNAFHFDVACGWYCTWQYWSIITLLIHIVYPKIVNISSNTVATEGHTVLLYCTGYGSPLPSIMWYYSDATINYHNTTTTNMYTVHSVLVLTNVSSHDSGVYRCQLTSELNITSHDIVLTVHVPPVQGMVHCIHVHTNYYYTLYIVVSLIFKATPTNTLLVKEGDTVNINYTIRGYPLPEISLFVNDNIEDNTDIITKVNGSITMITLTLTNISRGDPTQYNLVAHNGIESIHATTIVMVLCKLI